MGRNDAQYELTISAYAASKTFQNSSRVGAQISLVRRKASTFPDHGAAGYLLCQNMNNRKCAVG